MSSASTGATGDRSASWATQGSDSPISQHPQRKRQRQQRDHNENVTMNETIGDHNENFMNENACSAPVTPKPGRRQITLWVRRVIVVKEEPDSE